VGLNLDRLERDSTELRERMSYMIVAKVGLPFSHMRFVNLYMNDRRKSQVYADVQQPNGDYLKCWFPNEAEGDLFKIDDWFEFDDGPQISRQFNINATLQNFTTVGGVKKKARYRWSWGLDPLCSEAENYTNLFDLVDVMNMNENTPQFEAAVRGFIHEDFVRSVAIRHVVADWDGYGYNRGKNSSVYKPDFGKWRLLQWDLDMALGASSSSSAGLFSVNDAVLRNNFLQHWSIRRDYWRTIYDAVNGPLQQACYDQILDQSYNAFQAAGLSIADPAPVKTWLQQRRDYLTTQLAGVASPFEITTNGGNDFNTSQTIEILSGVAPVNVETLRVNGVPFVVNWASVNAWSIQVGLIVGPNVILVEGYDTDGNLVASDTITITLTDDSISPEGFLIINEVQYNPSLPNAEFVEIYNRSSIHAFDLSGYRLNGVDYTFPPGTVIQPQAYMVIVENEPTFIAAYGAIGGLVGEYNGNLDNGGETLSIMSPDDVVIDSFRYDDLPPWDADADGGGPSLQLIDVNQNNDVIGNWVADTVVLYTPGVVNSVSTTLPIFPTLRINEVQPNNLNAAMDNAG
ncbi:MAG: CotH kinase family protein, partial [Verrucomicrobiota bacterium]